MDLCLNAWSQNGCFAIYLLGLQLILLLNRLALQFLFALWAHSAVGTGDALPLDRVEAIQTAPIELNGRTCIRHAHDLVGDAVRLLLVFVIWSADAEFGLHDWVKRRHRGDRTGKP